MGKTKKDTADKAYINKKTNSIITVNSTCKKYESSTLKHLTLNILGGVQKFKILKQELNILFKRELLRTYAKGKIDGVKIYIRTDIFKKNRCIYDFILIANNYKNLIQDEKDFNLFLKTTQIK